MPPPLSCLPASALPLCSVPYLKESTPPCGAVWGGNRCTHSGSGCPTTSIFRGNTPSLGGESRRRVWLLEKLPSRSRSNVPSCKGRKVNSNGANIDRCKYGREHGRRINLFSFLLLQDVSQAWFLCTIHLDLPCMLEGVPWRNGELCVLWLSRGHLANI